MKHLVKLLALASLAIGLASPAHALVSSVCTGKFLNPVSDLDWNLMYPITIAGARLSGASSWSNPALMEIMPPVCVCPTIIGIPLPGIGLTYWTPSRIMEVENRPGCLSTLGGVSVLPGFSMLTSEMTGQQGEEAGVSRMQVHSYNYPVFEMLDMMMTSSCKNEGNYDLGYMTEIDPTWQDDLWASVFAPESALFANPLAQAACALDGIATELHSPIDALFWCAGTWGSVYPLTGNAATNINGHAQNNQVITKFIARNARVGLEQMTIGPTAICFSHPSPILVKSQYRFNQVGPVPRRGRPVTTGATGSTQMPPWSNAPTREHNATVLWQGKQCCMKLIP